jgi:hypothetical protein
VPGRIVASTNLGGPICVLAQAQDCGLHRFAGTQPPVAWAARKDLSDSPTREDRTWSPRRWCTLRRISALSRLVADAAGPAETARTSRSFTFGADPLTV